MMQIRKCLITASDEGMLRTPVHSILSLLNVEMRRGPGRDGVATLSGGAALDKEQEGEEFFYRDDDARIRFAITVRFDGASQELSSYRFHLQFPAETVPAYTRFDLNPGPSDDPLLEPRCHVHIGAEDLRVPAPVMSPIEILNKLLYGMPLPH
jgi:hypothetical protein